jgi:hypothetical protein
MTPEMKETLRILIDTELQMIQEAHDEGIEWTEKVYVPEKQRAAHYSTEAIPLGEWKHRVKSVRELIK